MAPPPSQRALLPRQLPLPAWLRPQRAGGPQATLQREGSRGCLKLTGDWQAPALPAPPDAAALQGLDSLRVDCSALQGSDARLPAWLWPVVQAAQNGNASTLELDLQALPLQARAGLAAALAQSVNAAAAAAPDAEPEAGWVAGVGRSAAAAWQTRLQTLNFLGQVALSAVAALGRGVQRGTRSRLRAADVAFQFEQVGPRSLPIVLLVSALVGLILAYMGGAQLELFGAQSFVAPLVSIGEVREIAALVVGIVLSGRVGASFAAQLATMQGSEEIDALRCLGVDPVDNLVLPRLLALVLAAPLLTVLGAVAGAVAGGAVSVGLYGVAPREYLTRSLDVLSLTHVAVGLFKGLLYGLLVGLAGCRQGLYAERSALGVGRATTDAVVQSIVWVAMAAATTTVVFYQLGW